jgi:LmbE family N-acetylglucosaminyl deacetylase
MGKVALTVSPHPDDEVLGLGATLALLLERSWTVYNLACSAMPTIANAASTSCARPADDSASPAP